MSDDFDFSIEETTGQTLTTPKAKPSASNGSASKEANGVVFTSETIFTTGQIAKIFKVAPRTVSKWFDSGKLNGHRIPGSQDRRIPYAFAVEFARNFNQPVALAYLTQGAAQNCKILFLGDPTTYASIKAAVSDSFEVLLLSSGFDVGCAVQAGGVGACIMDLSVIGADSGVNLAKRLYAEHDMALIAIWNDEVAGFDRSCFHETFRRPFEAPLLAQRVNTHLSK